MKLVIATFLLLAVLFIFWTVLPRPEKGFVRAVTRRYFWPLLGIFLAVVALAMLAFSGLQIQIL